MDKTLPDIQQDFSGWYNEVVFRAELVDQAPVRGSFVIRPYGYALWEQVRNELDQRIRETGHKNAAFPLLIPESFLKREAKHVEGFAPEVAVVTHAGGKKLEEPLVIRPTSETIVHAMFARWISSWRDLPLKINQWANIVRWELRTRPFLRTTEIHWQEGHTAHATRQEAQEEVQIMLNEYVRLAQDYLAIPVITGQKSALERFPGAEETHTFEALMPDGKALQMGTSHLLLPSFAESFSIQYQDQSGTLMQPHLTSWGVTTRLLGATVMMHGDQSGLILPPKVAPIQAVLIPIFAKGKDADTVRNAIDTAAQSLKNVGVRVEVDADTSEHPGSKFYRWELKGVPLRIEIGPRDLKNGVATIFNRLSKERTAVPLDGLVKAIPDMLDTFQTALFERAQAKFQSLLHRGENLESFGKSLEDDGGMYQTGWCGLDACEQELKKYKAGTRCVLATTECANCFACGKKSVHDVLVAKGY